MYRQRKLEKRYLVIIIIFIIAIVLGLLTFIVRDKRSLNTVEKAIKDSTLFVGKIVYSPINFVKDKINEIKDKNNVYEKYVKLEKKYEKMKLLEAKYEESLKNNKEMQELLELNNNLAEDSYLNATVINRNIGYWYNTITIDKGSHNGVEEGMAVITKDGLIGQIIKVSNFNSTIKLLTSSDTNNKISVKIENNGTYIYGLLTGYDSKTNSFSIEGISENTEIPTNSTVTTTGLGDKFPSGIPIGIVKRVSTDNFELARTAEVEPYANFDDISYVTILKRKSDSWF